MTKEEQLIELNRSQKLDKIYAKLYEQEKAIFNKLFEITKYDLYAKIRTSFTEYASALFEFSYTVDFSHLDSESAAKTEENRFEKPMTKFWEEMHRLTSSIERKYKALISGTKKFIEWKDDDKFLNELLPLIRKYKKNVNTYITIALDYEHKYANDLY